MGDPVRPMKHIFPLKKKRNHTDLVRVGRPSIFDVCGPDIEFDGNENLEPLSEFEFGFRRCWIGLS